MSIREIIFTGPAGHRARFTAFGVIGAALFWLGLGLQALLTGAWHLGAVTSFLVQGVISVELSFVANRHWTWRREHVPFWRAWRRFNGQKTLTILANLALYAVMLRAGINYLAANVATTALFTVVNYAGAHWWAFRPYGRGGRRGAAEAATPPAEAATIPAATIPAAPVFGSGQQAVRTVSVVVPCRGNERTIRATVDSLLAQD
jgi:putative flippase GtrA